MSGNLKVELNHGGGLLGINLKSVKDREIRAFLGVPYAEPPVGNLRFEPPTPFPPWKGVRQATKEGNVCPQFDQTGEIGNEDCLFLNIYTSPLEVIKKSGNLPVMVWIHGGGWIVGSGNRDSYGPEFFLDHDIILVTGNYRLGALGFLSSETTEYPGNNALKDQLEMLKWVKEHIHSFGGIQSQ
ncbi:CES5A.2 family protein [Megaselia abdita]